MGWAMGVTIGVYMLGVLDLWIFGHTFRIALWYLATAAGVTRMFWLEWQHRRVYWSERKSEMTARHRREQEQFSAARAQWEQSQEQSLARQAAAAGLSNGREPQESRQ